MKKFYNLGEWDPHCFMQLQGLFSPFLDNDPYPWNWEFLRVNAPNWEFFSVLCYIVKS